MSWPYNYRNLFPQPSVMNHALPNIQEHNNFQNKISLQHNSAIYDKNTAFFTCTSRFEVSSHHQAQFVNRNSIPSHTLTIKPTNQPGSYLPLQFPNNESTNTHVNPIGCGGLHWEVNASAESLVQSFLLKIGKADLTSRFRPSEYKVSSGSAHIKISEVRLLQFKAKTLIKKLQKCVDNHEIEINYPSNSYLLYKNELEDILSTLSNPEVIKTIQSQLAARKKKRNKIRQAKQRAFFDRHLKSANVQSMSNKTTEWLKLQEIKLKNQMQEQEMQKFLHKALLELRQKLTTITKSLEMIDALINLRKARYSSFLRKGQDFPNLPKTDQFNSKAIRTKDMLLISKKSVTKEIDALKLLLEAEKNKIELRSKEHLKSLQKQDMAKNIDPFDPLWPVQQVHYHGNHNLTTLVQYRCLWDQYLSENGSPIPVGKIEPSEMSDGKPWSKYKVE